MSACGGAVDARIRLCRHPGESDAREALVPAGLGGKVNIDHVFRNSGARLKLSKLRWP